ncbi:MAG: hypothetical protein U0746_04945 [Gemmataceae bacterium]
MLPIRFALAVALAASALHAAPPDVRVDERAGIVSVETDVLSATIRTRGYVSGTAAGALVDKATGCRDLGFGLHVMDFLLAPGWRDDGYSRESKWHGNLPKHYVEGPQICTQAKELKPEIIRGADYAAIRFRFTFHQPGAGYKAGSTWEQTLAFKSGLRYMLSSERITSVNDVNDLFYRIDMPGHVKHKGGDTFEQVYLSYRDQPISSAEFREDFAPDAKYLYRRDDTNVPKRMIRAYKVKGGPWVAGITFDPSTVREAWCHQRGYICMIQELHGRRVQAGEAFGAAYAVGWFDDIAGMERVADENRGVKAIAVGVDRLELIRDTARSR